jgi:hypothetical protein
MSKLLMIVGILLAALGIITALLVIFSFGRMQIYGITPEVAAVFVVGGFMTFGLGAVVDAMMRFSGGMGEIRERLARIESEAGSVAAKVAPAVAAAAAAAATDSSRIPPPVQPAAEPASRIFEPARSRAEAAAASIKSDAEEMIAEARRAAAETSAALDQAKAQIEEALSPEEITIPPGPRRAEISPIQDEPTESPPPAQPEAVKAAQPDVGGPPPVEMEEELADDQLYVVEERMIRGRPARVLSDGTVEAETDEGWMRFENLEHLEEYLDAMSPGRA